MGLSLQFRVAREMRRKALGYLFALGGVAAVMALRFAIGPPGLSLHLTFALLFVAIAASAAQGGLGPGLAATMLSALGSLGFRLYDGATLDTPEDRLGFGLFVIAGIALTLLGNLVHRARRRTEIVALGASRDRDQMFREVSERRRAEAAQQLLASIVESSQDAIYGKSLDGTITSWNAAAERLYGYTAEEILGQPSTMLTPADHVGEQSAVLVQNHDVAEHFETVRRRKDGTIIHVSTTISPLRDKSGVVVGSSTIARDITPQKRAEEELKKAQEQLREADRRKDEFLAILAHELRNPLAPLRNALGILKQANGEAAAEARSMAERQVHHLARLVDDLLDVSRITHGRIELHRERVELRSVVGHAVEAARSAIEAKGHELTVSLPETAVWLQADEVRLVQILANLLNNAVQYTAQGGRIALSATEHEGIVDVRVKDTGLGIAPEALPRVFDMFTQVSPKESRTPHSLGIGLRLVKGLVEMHGGRVEARSAGTGRGSMFVVRLPTCKSPEVRQADTLPPLSMINGKRHLDR